MTSKKEQWEKNYNNLYSFWKENNTSSVPLHHELYEWCNVQRNNKKLAKYKKEMLNNISFVWDVEIDESHKKYLDRIYHFYKKKGVFQSTNNDTTNFLKLCIYRKCKGVLPAALQHAFDEREITID